MGKLWSDYCDYFTKKMAILLHYESVMSLFCFVFSRYTAHVTGHNHISSKMSGPIQIHIVEPLSFVNIEQLSGETVLGHELTLHASHYSGSNVTYTWDFGDNNVTTVTESKIRHTYNM